MTTVDEASPKTPQPTFPHQAYGVSLTWFGEDGGYAAAGHVPPARFLAACNHLSRTLGSRNAADGDPDATAEDWLAYVSHVWALPEPPPYPYEQDWWVRYDTTVTAATPGAIAMTVWEL